LAKIETGVPQGLILGALLFNINAIFVICVEQNSYFFRFLEMAFSIS